MTNRPGRKVLFEAPFNPIQTYGGRNHYVSVPFAPELAHRSFLMEALEMLAIGQRFAERDYGRVNLELVCAVQHGEHVPISYTLHFEVTPCAA